MDKLRLDFCSHQAARYAIMRWHYSRAMPSAKLVRIGVWEGKRFVGAILYGSGANRHIGRPFGVESTQVAELVRVALAPGRKYPTSQALGISLRLVKRQSPGLHLIVSYADAKQGHVGTIYQATNWIFLEASSQPYLKVKGELTHPRTLYERYGRGGQSLPWLRKHVDPAAARIPMPPKYKYVWPFEKKLRKKLEAIAKPYPKRVESRDSAVPGDQPGEGGATPTSTLQPHGQTVHSL